MHDAFVCLAFLTIFFLPCVVATRAGKEAAQE
jgi:hypothetical protein